MNVKSKIKLILFYNVSYNSNLSHTHFSNKIIFNKEDVECIFNEFKYCHSKFTISGDI